MADHPGMSESCGRGFKTKTAPVINVYLYNESTAFALTIRSAVFSRKIIRGMSQTLIIHGFQHTRARKALTAAHKAR